MPTFMQLMPKSTGRYVQTYQQASGAWDVMPEQNNLVKKLDIQSNNSCAGTSFHQNSLIEKYTWINADVVDPVVSLLLQRKTLEYFTDSNVHDRIYSKISKHNK